MANPYDRFYKANVTEKKNACRISIFEANVNSNNLEFLCGKSGNNSPVLNKNDDNIDRMKESFIRFCPNDKFYCPMCKIIFDQKEHFMIHMKEYIHYNSSSDSSDDSDHEVTHENLDDIEDDSDDNDKYVYISNDVNLNSTIELFSECQLSFHEALRYETLFFKNIGNEVIGINRSILFSRENKPENINDLLRNVDYVMKCRKIAVFMYSGDVFVGAIFDGINYVVHKTIRHYLVRRKQGGRQGKYDNRNATGAKSAGAQIRREEYAKMQNEIYELIHKDWANYLDDCGLILIWASRTRRFMFGCPNTYKNLKFNWKTDPRVRFLIGGVARLNKEALKQMYIRAISVEVFDKMALDMLIEDLKNAEVKNDEIMEKNNNNGAKKPKKGQLGDENNKGDAKYHRKNSQKSVVNTNDKVELSKLEKDFSERVTVRKKRESKSDEPKVLTPEEIEEEKLKLKLFNLVINEAVEDLVELLEAIKPSDRLAKVICCFVQKNTQTLLHLAINNNMFKVIPTLLKYGCCPTLKNNCNLTPYDFANQTNKKEACTIMKNYMFDNPHKYDYVKAKIPGGEDPIKELERINLQKEKKKEKDKERKKRKQRQLTQERLAEAEKQKFLAMNNQEKIQFIEDRKRENRKFLLCFQCSHEIIDNFPFSYCDYYFCSTTCLQIHRDH